MTRSQYESGIRILLSAAAIGLGVALAREAGATSDEWAYASVITSMLSGRIIERLLP